MNFAIIAAGEGSRLAKEGILDPKPLIKINGEPLIARLLRIFTDNGAENIAVICNEQMTAVQDFLRQAQKDLAAKGVNLSLVVKSTPSSMHSFYELSKVLQTVGAGLVSARGYEPNGFIAAVERPGGHKARPYGKFIMTTVDTIFNEAEFADYVKTFENDDEADGMMGLTQYIDDEKPLYVGVSIPKDSLTNNSSHARITGYYDQQESCNHISAGIYGLTPRAFQTLNRCIQEGQSRMRNFQRALIKDGLLLKPYVFGKVFDIDHAEDIRKATELF